jgi:hypothetical protein
MPFLKNSPEEDFSHQHPLNSSSIINYSLPLANESTTAADGDVWTVKTLFPLTGSASICVAALFVFYFIRDCGKQKVTGGGPAVTEEKGEGVTKRGRLVLEIVVISLLSLMFFLYVGLEVAYGTFLTVFSVRSKLGRYLIQFHSTSSVCRVLCLAPTPVDRYRYRVPLLLVWGLVNLEKTQRCSFCSGSYEMSLRGKIAT